MKKYVPHILTVAMLATSVSAQLQFDEKFYGPNALVLTSFSSITVDPPAFSQWIAEESAAYRSSVHWKMPSPIGVPFTMSEAGSPSTVVPSAGTPQQFGLWNGSVAAPAAGPPQTLYFWNVNATWASAANGKNPALHGPLSKQEMANDRHFNLPLDWSSSPTAISRMQPYNDVTAVPEPSTIGGASVLLAFVAIHFFRQRRKQKATA